MTGKDRVRCALRFQEADRVPFGEFAVDYEMVSRVVGRPSLLRGRFLEDQALADGRWEELAEDYTRDFFEVVDFFGWDILVMTVLPSRRGTHLPWQPTSEEGVYTRGDGALYRRSPQNWMIRIGDDLSAASQIPPLDSLVYREPELPDDSCFAAIDAITARYGQSHYLVLRLPFEIDYPMFGRTPAEGYENLLAEEGLVEHWMEIHHRQSVALTSKLLERCPNVDAILHAVDYGYNGGPLVSPRLFRRWIMPGLSALSTEAHSRGKALFQHACGNNWALLDAFVEAGIDVYQSIQMSAGMDMARLKAQYGKRLTLWGGVGMESLISGTPQDIRNESLRALRVAAPGGGFIAGASHSIGVGVGFENYLSMVQALKDFGRYPISVPN